MSVIVAPRRRRKAARRLDLTDLKKALHDRRVWSALGVVISAGNGPHFEVMSEGGRSVVLLDVELVPGGEDVTCHLAGAGGLWRVPAVGAEVAVWIPSGRLDFMPVCVALGDAPDRVSDERTVLVAADVVEITAPKVVLGPNPEMVTPLDGVVTGQGIDTLTGMKYAALGNASTKVMAKK